MYLLALMMAAAVLLVTSILLPASGKENVDGSMNLD
jgi:hypothetical protein